MPTEKLKVRQLRQRAWISVVGFCLVLLLPIPASADTLTGKVVKITDGDTIYVAMTDGSFVRQSSARRFALAASGGGAPSSPEQ